MVAGHFGNDKRLGVLADQAICNLDTGHRHLVRKTGEEAV
jgi:hypothetical protein